MILSDIDILHAISCGAIVIDPFHREKLGTNSYDVHLSPHLSRFKEKTLDARQPTKMHDFTIPENGYVLQPGELYLGSTIEYTESHVHLPIINGKSSIGRLGLCIHQTAGWGDIGFCGHWTLEFSVVKPLRVYAGMPIGQIMWMAAVSAPQVSYNAKPSANYTQQPATPQPSKLWKDFENKRIEWEHLTKT